MGTGRFVAVVRPARAGRGGRLVGEGDPEAQARQVFENLRRCLAAAGASFDDVVKLTYFVTDMAHLPAIRTARAAHLPDDRLPAASAVQVAALVRPEFLMEIEAFAVVRGLTRCHLCLGIRASARTAASASAGWARASFRTGAARASPRLPSPSTQARATRRYGSCGRSRRCRVVISAGTDSGARSSVRSRTGWRA